MSKTSRSACLVLVTAPDRRVARRIARAALQVRAAACVNLVPGVESHYCWQGRVESSREVLLVFKTPRRLVPALERVVLQTHPYDTPEFVVVEIARGNRRYLAWIAASCGPA